MDTSFNGYQSLLNLYTLSVDDISITNITADTLEVTGGTTLSTLYVADGTTLTTLSGTTGSFDDITCNTIIGQTGTFTDLITTGFTSDTSNINTLNANNVFLPTLFNSGILYLDPSYQVKSQQMNDGDIIIGAFGSVPEANGLTRGSNIVITNAPNHITIGVTTAPTFTSLTAVSVAGTTMTYTYLNGTTGTITNINNSRLSGITATLSNLISTIISGSTATITNINNSILLGSTGIFTNLITTGLTATNLNIANLNITTGVTLPSLTVINGTTMNTVIVTGGSTFSGLLSGITATFTDLTGSQITGNTANILQTINTSNIIGLTATMLYGVDTSILTGVTGTITTINNSLLLGITASLTNTSSTIFTGSTATITNINNSRLSGTTANLTNTTSTIFTGTTATITNINNTTFSGSTATITNLKNSTILGSTFNIGNITSSNLIGITATSGSINNIRIGDVTAVGASFSSINGTAIANYVITTGPQTLTNMTIQGATITTGSINNTPIGNTTATTGAFTTIDTTGNIRVNAENTGIGVDNGNVRLGFVKQSGSRPFICCSNVASFGTIDFYRSDQTSILSNISTAGMTAMASFTTNNDFQVITATDSAGVTNGSINTAGGIGCAKTLRATQAVIGNMTCTSNLSVGGSLSVTNNVTVGGSLNVSDTVTVGLTLTCNGNINGISLPTIIGGETFCTIGSTQTMVNHFIRIPVLSCATGTTLTTSQSGSLVTLSGGTFSINIPTSAASANRGSNFKFTTNTTSLTGDITIKSSSTNLNGYLIAGTSQTVCLAKTNIIFKSGFVGRGDQLDIVEDDTGVYHVRGFFQTLGAVAVS